MRTSYKQISNIGTRTKIGSCQTKPTAVRDATVPKLELGPVWSIGPACLPVPSAKRLAFRTNDTNEILARIARRPDSGGGGSSPILVATCEVFGARVELK